MAVINDLKKRKTTVKDLVGYATAAPSAQNFDNFICVICMCLVYQPMQCQGCQNKMICKACIDQGKIKQCPMCKKWNQFDQPQKILLKVLDDLEVQCQGPDGSGKCEL